MRGLVGSGDSEKAYSDEILIDNPKLLRMTLKCLSSTITYRRHGRSSATQVERVFWLVNGFPTDSRAFPTIELFDCVIYKLIDTATWRWYYSVIGLFYYVVTFNTQTTFGTKASKQAACLFWLADFLCAYWFILLRVTHSGFYGNSITAISEVNGVLHCHFPLDLSWAWDLVNSRAVISRFPYYS